MGHETVDGGTGSIASSFRPRYQKPFSSITYLIGHTHGGPNSKIPVYGLH